ncbi:unnamed protein product [Moneuplotes crassus]|uniref:Uncharacterized protein n=1 Tax=Euplotes crassus TaxID=5936 RepID=A0AAD1YA61_EUPCR|nr:unnamed protein product [Moneuplotes crassus]
MKNHKVNILLSPGVNFSSLARNGSRYLKRQPSEGAEYISDTSPVRSQERKSSPRKINRSPQWLEQRASALRPSSSNSLNRSNSKAGKDVSQKPLQGQTIIGTKIEDNREVDKVSQVVPLKPITKFENKDFREHDSDLPPAEGETMKYEKNHFTELSFKDDHFGSAKQDLNQSSPLKIPRRNLDKEDGEFHKEAIHSKCSNDEFISVEGDFQELHSQPYGLDLQKSKEDQERMTDFSKEKRSPNQHFRSNTNLRSSLNHQMSERVLNYDLKGTLSRASSIDKMKSCGNDSDIKFTEKRDELSDRVSKYYFQKNSNFSDNVEAYDIVRQNLFPSFLNDPQKDRERGIRERSDSKNSKILTPSKIINELLDRKDSVTKVKKIQTKTITKEEKENEPMLEFRAVMYQDFHEVNKRESKERFIKGLFKQRENHIHSQFGTARLSKTRSDLTEPSVEKSPCQNSQIGYQKLGGGLIQGKIQEARRQKSTRRKKSTMKLKTTKVMKKMALKANQVELSSTLEKILVKNQKIKNALQTFCSSPGDPLDSKKVNMKLVKTYKSKSRKRKEKSKIRLNEDPKNLTLSKSTAVLQKANKNRKLGPVNYCKRALEWKKSRDLKLESKRKKAFKEEVSGCRFEPNLTKTMRSNDLHLKSAIHKKPSVLYDGPASALCPIINSKRLEERAKMRVKMSNKSRRPHCSTKSDIYSTTMYRML